MSADTPENLSDFLTENILDFLEEMEAAGYSEKRIAYYLRRALNNAGVDIDEDGGIYFL